MFRSIRNRLIASHILPSLLIIPLMGIAILYLLENRVLLPQVYANLSEDAKLMAEVVRSIPDVWQNPFSAQGFVESADPHLRSRITLLDPSGRVLASSESINTAVVDLPDFSAVERGVVIQRQDGPMAEVFAPVIGSDGQFYGVVRLTARVVTVSEEIFQLRYLLIGILFLAVLAGIMLGFYLADSISRPVRRVTAAIQAVARGDFQTSLREDGTEETRSLARAVNTLVDRLNDMEQSRQHLLANLVHELGRPLGALQSAIHALQKGADRDPELAKDLMNGMDDETARLRRLLNDLAGLHDQVLGSLELNRSPLDMQKWLPKILVPWEVAAEEKGVDWQTNILDGGLVLTADSDRLAQAIGNLCSNAVKFTPKGGTVTVSTGVEQDKLWVRVSDTGPGIQHQDIDRVFQPFYRADQQRRIIQGMGLGLSIARDIVQAHGGSIQVQSEPEKGAVFTVWLPLSG